MIGRLRNLSKEIYFRTQFIFRYLIFYHRFEKIGVHSIIKRPIRILGGKRIQIGDHVMILDGLRIEAIKQYKGYKYEPQLIIEDGVTMGQSVHIVCANKIVIHNNVLIGPYSMVNDTKHGYNDPDLPLSEQMLETAPIEIGEGTVIGMSVCVLPGVSIGRHCYIGANVVVAKDIPDNSIVASPRPRIVKIPY